VLNSKVESSLNSYGTNPNSTPLSTHTQKKEPSTRALMGKLNDLETVNTQVP
jgi:hypothetical protein